MDTEKEPLSSFVNKVRAMMGKVAYHYPLVAAQRQYRDRYYGLSAAAMLEDLFYDALMNFLKTHSPDSVLVRPPRGKKGFDYEFDGLKLSHKVSAYGPIEIAALWDATKTQVTHWDFENPICFSVGDYDKKAIKAVAVGSGTQYELRPVSRNPSHPKNSDLVLGSWRSDGLLEVLHCWRVEATGEIQELVTFDQLWPTLVQLPSTSGAVNEIDLFWVPRAHSSILTKGLQLMRNGLVHLPGIYVFAQSDLTNVELTKNNRGLLVPRVTVAKLMEQAVEAGRFVATGSWYSAFAGPNPPDLYLAQRSDFDAMFSASQAPWKLSDTVTLFF